MIKPVYRNLALLVYKEDIYRGQEEDKQLFKRIISYKEVNNKMWYKILQEGYKETIQELEENLENTKNEIKAYQRKLGQVIRRKKD